MNRKLISNQELASSLLIFKIKLKQLLARDGLTQKELAKKVGLSEATINNYVMGRRLPKDSTLRNIAKVFSIPLHVLLGQDRTTQLFLQSKSEEHMYSNFANTYHIDPLLAVSYFKRHMY